MQVKNKQISNNSCSQAFFIEKFSIKNKVLKACLLLFAFFSVNIFYGTPITNDVSEDITNNLIEQGFENVATVVDGKQVLITYENRAYRFEVKAIKEISKIVMPLIKDKYENLVLIVQNCAIPVVYVNIPVSAYKDFMEEKITGEEFSNLVIASVDTDTYRTSFDGLDKKNSSMRKFDLEIVPQLGLSLGAEEDAFMHVLNVAPKLSTSLWKGFTISAQLIQPISNEMDIPFEDYTRAGLITANQVFRLPHNFFTSITAGYFTNYVYGIDFELGKFLMGDKLLIKGKISYTGNMMYLKDGTESIWSSNTYEEKTVEYSDMYYLSGDIGIEYRFPEYDLTAGISYGKFLYFKEAWKFEFTRQFDEFNIGFVATNIDEGTNVGFQMAIPIYPKKYKTKNFRIRPSSYFQYTYFANSNMVSEYNNGNSLSKFFGNVNPYFIKNQLSEDINW